VHLDRYKALTPRLRRIIYGTQVEVGESVKRKDVIDEDEAD
jgi:hypothetical protein